MYIGALVSSLVLVSQIGQQDNGLCHLIHISGFVQSLALPVSVRVYIHILDAIPYQDYL